VNTGINEAPWQTDMTLHHWGNMVWHILVPGKTESGGLTLEEACFVKGDNNVYI